MTKQELIKKAKNQYVREWRKKNRDKVKQYNDRYWEKKAEELLKAEEQQSEV